jgi:hypothetical protein
MKPGMWNVYYVRSDGQERLALSAETAEDAAKALQENARELIRVIEAELPKCICPVKSGELCPVHHTLSANVVLAQL